MSNIDKFAELLGNLTNKQDHISRQFTGPTGNVVNRYEYYFDTIPLQDSGLRNYEQGLGSSFILGHGIWGLLGDQSPQPHLGDSRTGWDQIGPSGLII